MKSIFILFSLYVCLFAITANPYREPRDWEKVLPISLVGHCAMRMRLNCQYNDNCDKPIRIADAGSTHVVIRHDGWFFGSTKTIHHIYETDNWIKLPDSLCGTHQVYEFFVGALNTILSVFLVVFTYICIPISILGLLCICMSTRFYSSETELSRKGNRFDK